MSLWKRILDTLIDPNIIVLLLSLGVSRDHGRALQPGPHLPGHLRGGRPHRRPVRAPGAPGQRGGRASHAPRGGLLRGRTVRHEPWRARTRRRDLLRHRLAHALRSRRAPAIRFRSGSHSRLPAHSGFSWPSPLPRSSWLARRPVTGQEELVGQIGVVRKALAPSGFVFVHGELWQARSDGDPIAAGQSCSCRESRTASSCASGPSKPRSP